MTTNNYQDLQTPCFILDEIEFGRGISSLRGALGLRFTGVEIGYSVKTNSLPYALKLARRYGCMAEVVSRDEYRLARLCGYEPCEIIYNGPMKSKETFIESVTHGGIVNIETKRELVWLAELSSDRQYKIGLRLNINISQVSPEDSDGEDDNSRFGFSDESCEFEEAVTHISSFPHIHLTGLHIHRTAHSRSPRFYERSVNYAVSVIKKYDLNLEYLDIGGGYFGIFPNKPTFADYTEAIYRSLKKAELGSLRVIVEPGNALVASSFKFLSEVIDVKKIDEKTCFITTDGSRNDIDPFFHKTDYWKDIIYRSDDRVIESLQIATGCTCLEYDRMFSLHDSPKLAVGDRILYNNVGAYTMTLTPQFIRLWPRVYAIDASGNYRLVRREGRAEDIMFE